MNISSFLSGKYLTQVDLPQPSQVWTIAEANQQLVGNDQKVCISFVEFPAKPLGLNKTNLRRIADLYGLDASSWSGKQLQVYRSQTTYSGKLMLCVRVCGPQEPPPESVCDDQGNPVPPAPVASMPARQQVNASPQPSAAAQPVAAPKPTPWEADQPAQQQSSPPSA